MKPASRKKTRKSRSSSGNPVIPKKEAPFFQPQEGGEYSFFQPQANVLPGNVQAKMENAMGEDFSGVHIHENSVAASEMHAKAFTQGENIHFAPGEYNPETHSGQELIGHEFAHVKQQRQGRVSASLQLKGRHVNTESSLEAEADAMGRNAAGASVESGSAALGLRRSMSGKAGSGVLQMSTEIVGTNFGEFKAEPYEDSSGMGQNSVQIRLLFMPNTQVDATKIGLSQTIRNQVLGSKAFLSPVDANRQTADGTLIDALNDHANPITAADVVTRPKDSLGSTPTDRKSFWGKYGRKNPTTGAWNAAILEDTPKLRSGPGSSQKFESAALALEGAQKGMYYGSVNWGWEVDSNGAFIQSKLTIASRGDVPSIGFRDAARAWNNAKVIGTIKTTADPTYVYNKLFKQDFTLDNGVTVVLGNEKSMSDDIIYNNITDAAGRTGRVKVSDLEDVGGGQETLDLPIPSEAIVTSDVAYLIEDASGSDSDNVLAELPMGTKMTVADEASYIIGTNAWKEVRIDLGQAGIKVMQRNGIDASNRMRGFVEQSRIRNKR